MPVPQSIDDLSVTPANNHPMGSENVGPIANQYFQAAFSFLRQIANGAYFKPLAALNMNGQKLTNLAEGDTSSSSKDAITGAQALALAYKKGEIRMWNGTVANIGKVWGAGWQLADGTNSTPDLRERFIVGVSSGASTKYALGATGGSEAMTSGQVPSHTHAVAESVHSHGVSDPGHAHATQESPHTHLVQRVTADGAGSGSVPTDGGWTAQKSITLQTTPATTGVAVRAAGTGIQVNASKTGIKVAASTGPASADIRPPYYALCYLGYTGIGA